MKRKTPEQKAQMLAYVTAHYKTTKIKVLAAHFNYTEPSMRSYLARHQLKKNQRTQGKPYLTNYDGRKLWVQTVNGKTCYTHRLQWEAVHGPIPEGYHLRCKGDSTDTSPANWVLVTKREHARLNQNPAKAREKHLALWKRIRRYEQMGLTPHFTKMRSKRKTTHTPVFAHAPNAHITF
jgi:hypothetical protein